MRFVPISIATVAWLILAAARAMAEAPDLAAAYQPLSLTADQAESDIVLMRRALELIHPGLFRYRTRDEI